MKKLFWLIYPAIIYLLIASLHCGAAETAAQQQPATVPKKIFFTLQVESMANRDRAYGLEENLMDKGYPAYVEEIPDNAGSSTYQVRIGKYQTREEAEAAARTFYAKEKKSYWITATDLESGASSATAIPASTTTKGTELPEEKSSSGNGEKKEQREAAPAASEKIPGAEKQLLLKSPNPPADERQKAADSSATTSIRAPAQPHSAWPQAVSRIYTYRDPQGYLRITNSAEKIPPELQQSIESVSVFPVKYLSFNQKEQVLVLEIEGKQEELKLAGVDLDSAAAGKGAAAFFEKVLKDVPLRLKYAPAQHEAKKAIMWGTLLSKQGTSVNIELIRQGIAPCDSDSAPPVQKQAFMEAETAARSAKTGIWAEHSEQQ